nr:Apyrase domain containing protein [Haemonchus contortus]
MNVKGRAMELSDLTVFHNRVLTPDDRTGLISEIRDNQIIPWVFLNSGPGNTTDAFKCEWMTIKDGLLYVGSHGVEYKTRHGSHRNNMWVKTVSSKGEVRGTNLLISSTNLDQFEFKTVGEVVPERGYSAFAFIPDTNDDLIVALKSKEVGDSTATYITVFNIEGQVILHDQELSGDFKFEGLYFL